MKAKFYKLVEEYNLHCRLKYQRPYWRDLEPREFGLYPALREALFSWASSEGRISPSGVRIMGEFLDAAFHPASISTKQLRVLAKGDIDEIVKMLLDGYLAAISNGMIYVLFGADDDEHTNEAAKKINLDKLRHPLTPVGRLSFPDSIPYQYVVNERMQEFLHRLVEHVTPIGLLLPDEKPGVMSLCVFYGGVFFEELASLLGSARNAKKDIYASSANITTTGANTTAQGVLRDFSLSKYTLAVVNEGDLKRKSEHGNSSTIVQCSREGILSYYRIGYPSQGCISEFAQMFGVEIHQLPTTRQSFSR